MLGDHGVKPKEAMSFTQSKNDSILLNRSGEISGLLSKLIDVFIGPEPSSLCQDIGTIRQHIYDFAIRVIDRWVFLACCPTDRVL